MTFKRIIFKYIFSPDLYLSIIISSCVIPLLLLNTDDDLFLSIFNELTGVGVTIFTVMFPLFFTAFSVIITSSDDDFSKFLQERGYYQEIINAYKYTLLLIFIAFIYSILLFSTINVLHSLLDDNTFYFIVFLYMFILFYSLFASFTSILDSIRYAQRRGIFFFNKK